MALSLGKLSKIESLNKMNNGFKKERKHLVNSLKKPGHFLFLPRRQRGIWRLCRRKTTNSLDFPYFDQKNFARSGERRSKLFRLQRKNLAGEKSR